MIDFINDCFLGPNLIATCVLLMALMYWILVMMGLLGIDALDFDMDFSVDTDVDVALSSGAVFLRFLNLGDVPLMLWVSTFAVGFWASSMSLNDPDKFAAMSYMLGMSAVNVVVGVIVAKALTQPLRGKFTPVEPNKAAELVGNDCVVTTSEVTDSFGQARYETEAAPLLINVRCENETLHKDDLATIVRYDLATKLYLVKKASSNLGEQS